MDEQGSYAWLDWYRQLRNYISQQGSVPWNVIDFSGSDIVNIAARSHQNLQSLQGGTPGQYYHLTAAQYAALTAGPHNDLSGKQGGTTNEYYHITQAQEAALDSGLSVTVTLAKITPGGVNGSLTFTNGILTAKVDPT